MKKTINLDLNNLIKDNKHLTILLYYIVMWFGYRYLNDTTVPEIYLYSPIDDYIPFVKEMAIPYISWYLYIVIPMVYFGFKSPEDFTRLCVFMFSGMTICYLIWWLMPNGQNLRPEALGSDVFSNILKNIYSSDNPTNSLPSMHVIDAIAVNVSIANSFAFKNNKKIKTASFIICILICFSTVMVKQHSIIDVFAGLVVSWILYMIIYEFDIVYRFNNFFDDRKASIMSSASALGSTKNYSKRNTEPYRQ